MTARTCRIGGSCTYDGRQAGDQVRVRGDKGGAKGGRCGSRVVRWEQRLDEISVQDVEKVQWESIYDGWDDAKRGRSRQNGRENGRDLSSSLLRGAPVSLPAQSQSSVRALLRIRSRSSARKPLAPTRDPPGAPPPSPSLHTTHLRTSPPAPPRPPVLSSTLYKQRSVSPLPGHRSNTATSPVLQVATSQSSVPFPPIISPTHLPLPTPHPPPLATPSSSHATPKAKLFASTGVSRAQLLQLWVQVSRTRL